MAFFNRKNKDQKKKGESIIGKIIYGFLLFAPIFNILVTCMYVTFNKNAYQSYSDKYIESYTKVTTNTQLVENNQYQIIYNENTTGIVSAVFNVYDTNLNELLNLEDLTIQTIYVINETNYARINLLLSDNSTMRIDNWNNQFTTFYFSLKSTNYNPQDAMNRCNIYLLTYTQHSLDNAFVYGTQKTEESNLFNWSKTTGTYTVLANVCNGIGITNTFTPMLMAYWLLISVIYFIYDIALILIWAVHDKIHELKDAI